MKKYIVIALCALLLITAAVPTLAAEETKVTITPSATVVQRGETVDFTISVSGDVAFTSIAIKLSFDESVFEFVSGQDKTNGTGMLMPFDGTTVGLAFIGGAATYNGDLQVLTFKVKDDAPIKESSVTGEAKGSTPGNSDDLAVQFKGTSISVNCVHEYPDLDGDGNADWTSVDDEKHQRICSKCQHPDTQDHLWDEGTTLTPPDCTQGGTEKFTCLGCGHTKEEPVDALDHAWDNVCDPDCNREECDYTREVSHLYLSTWSSDENGHWHQCQKCQGKKDEAEHIPGPAATEQSAQTCTECNYVLAPILEHEHDWEEEWFADRDYHWYRCRKTGCYQTKDKTAHGYDNACDTDCNTCGYVRVAPHDYNSEWRASKNGHWQICAICNEQSQVYEHTPGPEATETEPQLCEDCHFRIKWPLSHVHTYGDTWYSDDINHWKTCLECQEPAETEAHTWDTGVATEDGTGTQYTCTICGKQVVESSSVQEPTTVPATQSGNGPTSAQNPTQQPEDEGRFPWEWAGIGAIVLLIIGIVLLIIEFMRSRKINMHGKFSK